MDIKVPGTGCASCKPKATISLIEKVAQGQGLPATLALVEEIGEIMGCGVMGTPDAVIDGKVVHAGRVPSRAQVEGWLAA